MMEKTVLPMYFQYSGPIIVSALNFFCSHPLLIDKSKYDTAKIPYLESDNQPERNTFYQTGLLFFRESCIVNMLKNAGRDFSRAEKIERQGLEDSYESYRFDSLCWSE